MGILRKFNLLMEEADSITGGGAPETPPENTDTTEEIIGKGTFFEGLEKDYYNDPSLKAFMDDKGNLDAKNIIKSYIHTKRQFGKDKIVVPGEHATEQEWRDVLTKLGLPSQKEEYNVAPKQDGFFDKEFVDKFKENAYNAGILPKQAQAMLDWYSQEVANTEQMMTEKAKEEVDGQMKKLKEDWGQAYDKNLNLARKAFHSFSDENLTKAIEEQGLGTNPTLLRLFAKIGDTLTKEGTIKGDSGIGSDPYSPSEIEDKIKEYMAEPAYWDKSHPSHNTVVGKVNKLYAQMG